MNDEKTIETINNLLSDFLREFEQKLPELFQPYKYTKEDVLPAWKAAFFRQNQAKGFCDSCVAYYAQFLATALPSVNEFCPAVKQTFDEKSAELNALLLEQLADVDRRRASYDPNVVMGGVMIVPPLIGSTIIPDLFRNVHYNQAVVRATTLVMRKFVELASEMLTK